MSAGTPTLSTNQKREITVIPPPGPPFAPNSANNGVSVNPVTGEIQFGDDFALGTTLSQLNTNRQLNLDTFFIRMSANSTGNASTNYFFGGSGFVVDPMVVENDFFNSPVPNNETGYAIRNNPGLVPPFDTNFNSYFFQDNLGTLMLRREDPSPGGGPGTGRIALQFQDTINGILDAAVLSKDATSGLARMAWFIFGGDDGLHTPQVVLDAGLITGSAVMQLNPSTVADPNAMVFDTGGGSGGDIILQNGTGSDFRFSGTNAQVNEGDLFVTHTTAAPTFTLVNDSGNPAVMQLHAATFLEPNRLDIDNAGTLGDIRISSLQGGFGELRVISGVGVTVNGGTGFGSAFDVNGGITTADPGTGTAEWFLGTRKAVASVFDPNHYVEIMIGGTVVKLATVV